MRPSLGLVKLSEKSASFCPSYSFYLVAFLLGVYFVVVGWVLLMLEVCL